MAGRWRNKIRKTRGNIEKLIILALTEKFTQSDKPECEIFNWKYLKKAC